MPFTTTGSICVTIKSTSITPKLFKAFLQPMNVPP
ncbi:hypothetical protein Alsa1_CDS0213 [Staphylococcus phage Alsa_1]|nr:hypothetical protein Alsa1_CDS0213 [Staphylococcus phage Alsa_1]